MGCFCTSRLIAAADAHRTENEEQNQMHDVLISRRHNVPGTSSTILRYFSATTRLVTRMFAIASGNRNFQPNAINWS